MCAVAVLGAGGTIAPAIVRDLAESEEITELLLLDLDRDRAREVADAHGCGKARAAGLDARAGSALADELHGYGALVNAASYRVNLEAMRACLAARCHYLDLGGLYWMTGRQLALGAEFRRAEQLAVLGIGSSPGKTNLMAALAVAELGGEVDSLHVAAAGRDIDPPEGESFPYALRTLLDELTMAPIAIRNGEPEELEPLTDGGEVDFGEPIGIAPTLYTLHSEMLTFPPSFGCHEASFRLSLPAAIESRLRELAATPGADIEQIAADASPPSSHTFAVHLVEAAGPRARVRVRSTTPPNQEWGLGGGVVSTASPIAAAVRMIARGEVTARGVHPPERCLDPAAMFAELRERGVRCEIETTEEVTA